MRDPAINDKKAPSPTRISTSDLDSASTSNIFSDLGSISRLSNPQSFSLENLPIMGKPKKRTKMSTVDSEEETRKLLYQTPAVTTASSSHAKAPDFIDIDPDQVSDIAESGNLFQLVNENEEEVTSEDKSSWVPVPEQGVARRFEPRFDLNDPLYSGVVNKVSKLKKHRPQETPSLGGFSRLYPIPESGRPGAVVHPIRRSRLDRF